MKLERGVFQLSTEEPRESVWLFHWVDNGSNSSYCHFLLGDVTKFGRGDSASPAPATTLAQPQQGQSQAHHTAQQPFLNPALPPGYSYTGLPYYTGMPGAFQYGPTMFVSIGTLAEKPASPGTQIPAPVDKSGHWGWRVLQLFSALACDSIAARCWSSPHLAPTRDTLRVCSNRFLQRQPSSTV